MKRLSHASWLVVVVLLSAAGVSAQGETIPEQLLRQGGPLIHVMSIPSGPVPSMTDVLRDTEIVIRGVVGQPRSYLTDDQREVLTDYTINSPAVLYQSTVTQASKTGTSTYAVTVPGGVVTIGGLTFTSKDYGLPPLEPGTECLFLLKRVGDQYRIVGWHYGIFQIAAAKLVPLSRREDFAPEYRGAPAADTVKQMITQRYALQPR